MSPEARGRSDAEGPEAVYRGEDAPEVVRLRRENARLRHRLVAMDRERDNLVARYEALLPDGAERDCDGAGGAQFADWRPGDGRAAGGRDRGTDASARSRSDGGSLVAAVGRFLRDRLR